jgi:hypothetical protein
MFQEKKCSPLSSVQRSNILHSLQQKYQAQFSSTSYEQLQAFESDSMQSYMLEIQKACLYASRQSSLPQSLALELLLVQDSSEPWALHQAFCTLHCRNVMTSIYELAQNNVSIDFLWNSTLKFLRSLCLLQENSSEAKKESGVSPKSLPQRMTLAKRIEKENLYAAYRLAVQFDCEAKSGGIITSTENSEELLAALLCVVERCFRTISPVK